MSKLTPYSPLGIQTRSRTHRHGHHPSTGDAPSSPAADASDAGAKDARNGVRREIHEIEDALKAFKIAVEAGEMTGFKVQRLPAAFNIRLKSKDSQV